MPKYIHHDVFIDELGGCELGKNIVISTKVILLTHDYSYNIGVLAINQKRKYDVCKKQAIKIGENSFIGANSTVLPGSTIGAYCVVGANSLVKGTFPDYSLIAGNPAKIIGDTREWGNKIIKNES